jgi:2-phospho-L-lactate transferase/gluconeogenesis factor (CofD/UPF0052 family)
MKQPLATTTPPLQSTTTNKTASNTVRELNKKVKVAIFCGGRGSASLIKEMMRWPQIEVSLIVNGYDDGLSTGHLRDLVPKMLGPSDFRKNLSRMIDLHSSEQYALQRLLEYRFPDSFSETDIKAFEEYVANPKPTAWLPSPLDKMMRELRPEIRKLVLKHLQLLFQYQQDNHQKLDYSDCSFGNLVFAAAYLKSNSNFNASVDSLAELFKTSVRLVNVTKGENRILTALKEDGQILTRESEIVGKQSASRIQELFLLETALDEATLAKLQELSLEEKLNSLKNLEVPVYISPEADLALRNADIIIYGPGTQFSSLFPSYKTVGLPQALEESRALAKVFVCNISEDHDIQGLSASDIVDKAASFMDDPDNAKHLITHIFCNEPPAQASGKIVPLGGLVDETYKNAAVIKGQFESAANPTTHSGSALIRKIVDVWEQLQNKTRLRALEIYVDLRDRSKAVDQLLEEFLDLRWTEQFESVRLRLNQPYEPGVKLPEFASLASDDHQGLFTEVNALLNWLAHSDTDYLVTISGDGEYRLRDIFNGVQILKLSPFGAVFGSRTQSRHQFRSALDSAYGEHSFLRFLSFCGAFYFTAIFGLLFRVILSDPFTGFRIYRRSKISTEFADALRRCGPAPSAKVTSLMLKHKIEIAEIPVTYRTFQGFTKPGWRIRRGLRNLLGLFG